MSIGPGTRVGPYEVTALLGEGGMGKVWRARHIALKRDDALKVLPDDFAADPERLARFQREAQVLASLNHPNIAHVFGLEDADGITALVMELVEGPTLADRIAHGAIPVDEALRIARQIAEALEAAHDQGIIHRDLKPGNIKVRADGTVKVLDFGLAKVLVPGPPALPDTPTMTSPAVTRVGVILGTAAYMAPEQATGTTVDARSDIWSLGVVLYELLTGKRAFDGDTKVEVLSNVLKAEPDWEALPPSTPPMIRSLLRRCVQKDPSKRLRHIVDARFQIEEALSETEGPVSSGVPRTTHKIRERVFWMTAVVTLAAAASAAWLLRPSPLEPDELHLEITTPPTTELVSLALSPDGNSLVFVGTSQGQSLLWLRPLDSSITRQLKGTENARFPFWSPDGRAVGFSANGQLKRVDLESGAVQVLVSSLATGGGTWNQDGTILFDPGSGSPLFRVSANGGKPSAVTQTNPDASDHWFPQFLPDQRHFLFYATGGAPGIYISELDASGTARRILEAQAATYMSSGHLLFVRQGTLFRQAFDLQRLEVVGNPTSEGEQIVLGPEAGSAALSVSEADRIVYRAGAGGSPSQFVWFDRSGQTLGVAHDSEPGDGFYSSLSSDDRRLAFSRFSRTATARTTDIWVLDLLRGLPSRFTSDENFELTPVWSPDGDAVAFSSNRRSKRGDIGFDVYIKRLASSASEELLIGAHPNQIPNDWSLDGRFLLYQASKADLRRRDQDLWAVPLNGNGKAFPVAESSFDETLGQFSPDNAWIAYQSDESGTFEIYVQRFPGPGRKTPITTGGGTQVRWRLDGKELFYLSPDNRLFAVSIKLDPASDTVDPGPPRQLFAPALTGTSRNPAARNYSVARDGQRFLVDRLKEVELPVRVVLNRKASPDGK